MGGATVLRRVARGRVDGVRGGDADIATLERLVSPMVILVQTLVVAALVGWLLTRLWRRRALRPVERRFVDAVAAGDYARADVEADLWFARAGHRHWRRVAGGHPGHPTRPPDGPGGAWPGNGLTAA